MLCCCYNFCESYLLDGFTCTVTEDEVKSNAKVMSDHLLDSGYEYVTIDYEWFRPGTGDFSCCGRNPWQDLVVDKYGRVLPSPDRYPSAKVCIMLLVIPFTGCLVLKRSRLVWRILNCSYIYCDNYHVTSK